MLSVEYNSEVWREVVGYAGYEVSSFGKVRSWKKHGRGGRRGSPVILDQCFGGKGYLQVSLSSNGRRKTFSVHTLVLNAFVGPRDSKELQTRHLDGNLENNSIDNLSWGSAFENSNDKAIHGTIASGEKHGNARLTASQVLEIVERRTAGETLVSVAKVYNVTLSHISWIMTGKSWSSVTGFENPRRKKETAGN